MIRNCYKLIEKLEENNFSITNSVINSNFCVLDIEIEEMKKHFINYFTKNPKQEIHEFSLQLFIKMSLEVKPDDNINIEFPIPKESFNTLFEIFNFNNFASNNEIKIHFWEVNHIHITIWKNDIYKFLKLLSEFYKNINEVI